MPCEMFSDRNDTLRDDGRSAPNRQRKHSPQVRGRRHRRPRLHRRRIPNNNGTPTAELRVREEQSEPFRGNAGKGAAVGMVVGSMSTRHNRREERKAKR